MIMLIMLMLILMHKVTREKSTLINAIIKTRRSRGHTFHFDFVLLLIALSFHDLLFLFP